MFYLINKNTNKIVNQSECRVDYELGPDEIVSGFASLLEITENPALFFNEYDEEIHYVTNERPRDINDIKEDVYKLVNISRDKRINEPITVSGITYDVDAKSKEMISGFILATNIIRQKIGDQSYVNTTEWTDYYNVSHSVTNLDLEMVILELAIRTDSIFSEFRDVKNRIELCETEEEIYSIKWTEATILTDR